MTTTTTVPAFPSQVAGTWTLASSLVHGGDETLGTTRLFRAKGMIYEGRKVSVPVVSGNAIRGLWRRSCALAFLDAYRAAGGGGISLSAFYYLTSGGSLAKGAASKGLDMDAVADLGRLIPYVGLFGGAGLGRIQPGKLWVDEAYPVCRETLPILRRLWPGADQVETAGLSIRALTEVRGYSRQDDAKDVHWHRYLAEPDAADARALVAAAESSDVAPVAGSPQQMRYEALELIAGTVLYHRWGFRWPPTEPELAGLGAGLLRWAERPHVGGRNAVGHGNLLVHYEGVTPDTRLLTDGAAVMEDLRGRTVDEALADHVAGHLDAITEMLGAL